MISFVNIGFFSTRRKLNAIIVISFILFLVNGNLVSAQNISKPEKVKSVTEVTVVTKGGKEVETKKSFQSFDAHGNVTEEIEYDDDGKVKDHATYEYNAAGQKVKETSFMPDGRIEDVTVYTYDENGNRISKTVMNKDGAVKSKKIFRYEYR